MKNRLKGRKKKIKGTKKKRYWGQKGKWEANKFNFVVKILGFQNWAWDLGKPFKINGTVYTSVYFFISCF
jgi:hypothetical protein